ncbi:MAG: SAM-dependent methyltransferase [Streptosporangiales bacterium]|nr:SAM-dependent methyltransferase [Streptosporangiales bacterium]
MADDWAEDATRRAKASLINTEVAHAPRVINCLYGGQSNFEADRRAARALATAAPGISGISPAARSYRRRVLRFLVEEAGIRQFLDIGAGLPLRGATHEVTQSLAPECRIAYVDNDPMVLSHARALMKSAPGGAVGYVDAGLSDPEAVVTGAGATLDFSQPVAVLLMFTLAYVTDAGQAAHAVSSLAKAVPAGSYVAIYHLASDMDEELDAALRTWNIMLPRQPLALRSAAEVEALTAGLEPVPPGVVPITDWRPDPADPRPVRPVPVHGIVALKR